MDGNLVVVQAPVRLLRGAGLVFLADINTVLVPFS